MVFPAAPEGTGFASGEHANAPKGPFPVFIDYTHINFLYTESTGVTVGQQENVDGIRESVVSRLSEMSSVECDAYDIGSREARGRS